MTGRVDELDAVRAVDSLIAKVDQKIDRHAAATLTASAEHREAVEAWKVRVRVAFDDGTIPGEPEPVKPESLRLADDHMARLRQEREVLGRDRLRAIADNGAEVLEGVATAVAETVERAGPLLAELDECLGVLRAARTDVSVVTDAVNAVSTVGTMKSPDVRPLDLLTLASAVTSGTDPLAPEQGHASRVLGLQVTTVAPDGSRATTAPVGDDPETARLRTAALGMQRNELAGRKRVRPLGYRGGDRLPRR